MKMCIKKHLLIFIFFIFLTLLFTYPVILKPSQSIYGIPQFHGDPFSMIWEIWWYRFARAENISSYPIISIVAYPWGWDRTNEPKLPVLGYIVKFLSGFSNEVLVYNIIIWIGLFGTAIAMYFFIYHFTQNRFISLISGVLFSFSQDHLMHSMQHLGFSLLLWMPLYLLSLFKLFDNPCYKNSFLYGLFFSLLIFTNYYYGYFMAVATIVFLTIRFIKYKFAMKELKFFIISIIFIFIFIFPLLYPLVNNVINSSAKITSPHYGQPYGDLFKYAAKWQDYLLPSEFHPLLGKLTRQYAERKWGERHYFERSLYIGFLPLILSVLSIIKQRHIKKLNPKYDFLMIFFTSLAITGFVFSLPPMIKIGNLKFPWPSFFMYNILPMFRVNCRFGILVVFSITVLASIGIRYLFDVIKKKNILVLVAGCIFIFTFIEIINYPPFHNIDLTNIPLVYKWLEKQYKDIVIAEYPWVSKIDTRHSDYLFFQRVHKKKLINGAQGGTLGDAFRKQCIDLSGIDTAQLLAYLGAEYVILHKELYGEDYIEAIDRNCGLKLFKNFPNEKVYKIIAKPIGLCTIYWHNFGSFEKWDDGSYWRWIGNNATVWVGNGPIINPKSIPVRLPGNRHGQMKFVDIKFRILAFAMVRDLEIYINNILAEKLSIPAPASPELAVEVVLKNVLLEPGENIIRFYTPQGETQIGKILHNNDNRNVSFAVRDLEILCRSKPR